MESPELDYPYRDDAIAVWKAIGEWVEDYLSVYYASDDDVARDFELAAWAKELVSEGGGRIRGFGEGGAGEIATRDYLCRACTMLIFTASAQHAAVNFPQRSIMAYAPILPMGGYAPAPRASGSYTEADHLRLFPPLETARKQVRELGALGGVYYKQLGEYGAGHFDDERVNASLEDFRRRLERIESDIEQRGQADMAAGRVPYRTLLPSAIPMSISI
jgi:arachidonate 15-lipoxygenase